MDKAITLTERECRTIELLLCNHHHDLIQKWLRAVHAEDNIEADRYNQQLQELGELVDKLQR